MSDPICLKIDILEKSRDMRNFAVPNSFVHLLIPMTSTDGMIFIRIRQVSVNVLVAGPEDPSTIAVMCDNPMQG